MNVCAKCGTPMAGGVMSCPACGGLPAAPVSVWQRVITCVIGTSLLALGARAMTTEIEGDLSTTVAAPPLLVGSVLVVTAIEPFGAFRLPRVLVGLAMGLAAFAIVAFTAGFIANLIVPVEDVEYDDYMNVSNLRTVVTVMVVSGLGAFCLAFYLGYRMAREEMNACSKCGAEMARGQLSCPDCGGLPVRSVNVCAKCRTPMTASEMLCPQCGGLPVRRVAPVSVWQRVIGGVIGFGLLATALALVLGWANFWGGSSPSPGEIGVAITLTMTGSPLLVSSFVEFAVLRRGLVGLAVGLAAGAVLGTFGGVVATAQYDVFESSGGGGATILTTGLVLASLGFLGGFYVGYGAAR